MMIWQDGNMSECFKVFKSVLCKIIVHSLVDELKWTHCSFYMATCNIVERDMRRCAIQRKECRVSVSATIIRSHFANDIISDEMWIAENASQCHVTMPRHNATSQCHVTMPRHTHIACVDKHITKRLLDPALNPSVYPVSNLRRPKLFKEYLNVQFLPHGKHLAFMKISSFWNPATCNPA